MPKLIIISQIRRDLACERGSVVLSTVLLNEVERQLVGISAEF